MKQLRLVVRSQPDIEYVIAIVCLGFLRAIRVDSAHLVRAEQQLFWPWVWDEVVQVGCSPRMVEILRKASELDDIRSLAPNTYQRTLDDLEEEVLGVLSELGVDSAGQPERWIQTSEI